VLLSEGKLVIDGTPEQVLTPEVIAEVFQVKAQVERVGANQLRVSYEMGGR
jgi:ABC-type cobalamin/Fe3+-siderophores transport system ATPase subunit